MSTYLKNFLGRFSRNSNSETKTVQETEPEETPTQVQTMPLDIPSSDPLLAYLTSTASPVEVDKLNLQSPTLERLREEGVKVAVPLVSQGELIGLLNLGPRLSEQEYSSEDRRLLSNLATQAAPALRVAQMARQQQAEARERERIEQELRVARIIQQTLLPKEVPQLPGWQIFTYWQPAREVGGDFYDFIQLPDGRTGILIADVTDKGVPAALVMATTRTLLRAAAERLISPGEVLRRTNELLHPDIPPKMFVTCLYAIFDPNSGHLVFANAGHNLPYISNKAGIKEERATGMPLGLMPGMEYEEKAIQLQPGDTLLLTSDGLIEAHNGNGEMYGFGRLKDLLKDDQGETRMIDMIMDTYQEFVGEDHEQEDDITLVTMEYLLTPPTDSGEWQLVSEFQVPSEPGNEREAAQLVLEALPDLQLDERGRSRLETAVAEAALNAIEHGNKYDAEKPVEVQVCQNETSLSIRIRDQGGGTPIPESVEPDLLAKLSGDQSPRGWGLFLIRNMVDEMNLSTDQHHHTIELILHLK